MDKKRTVAVESMTPPTLEEKPRDYIDARDVLKMPQADKDRIMERAADILIGREHRPLCSLCRKEGWDR
jgi:hypothetical protein